MVDGTTPTTAGTSRPTSSTITTPPPVSTAPPDTTSTTTTEPGTPVTADADGWRLSVTVPKSGEDIGPVPRICYEATGTSREPILALDVRLIEEASNSVVVETRVDISVGRGGVDVDLSAAPLGQYDLSIGLVVNGESPDGLVVRVPDVIVTDGSVAARCE